MLERAGYYRSLSPSPIPASVHPQSLPTPCATYSIFEGLLLHWDQKRGEPSHSFLAVLDCGNDEGDEADESTRHRNAAGAPGMVLSILHILTHLTLTTTPRR